VTGLARQYDLIVIDHPHVGQITAEQCLAALDIPGRDTELADPADNSVGQSFPSYSWRRRQWALAIDAAAQVMAFRADMIERAPASWPDLMALGEMGQLVVPMLEPRGLMTYFTLAASLGTPCATGPGEMIGLEAGIAVYDRLAALAAHLTRSISPWIRLLRPKL
jgi:multiple sugar transport system substrate-binding protein